jgi:hypothetical protein
MMSDPINGAFQRLRAAPEYGNDSEQRPIILGGRFDAGDRQADDANLSAFLLIWQERMGQMPWRIWEHISGIGFANEPADTRYLQRAELFGAGGHLSLRRDSGRWLWSYIGPAGVPTLKWRAELPAGEDFWTSAQGARATLRQYEEQVLLWGKATPSRSNEPSIWWEDRVARAKLAYPQVPQGSERVVLRLWRYTEDGRTAFVWYRALMPRQPG